MRVIVQIGRLWFARQWRRFVPGTFTIALCFGLAVFAIAGAQRTRSAYPRFLDHVHSSTVAVSTLGEYTDKTDAAIAALPEVVESRTFVGFSAFVLVDGRPDLANTYEAEGTFNGRFFDQDRFTATRGRAADPSRADEVTINEFAAERLGYHIGQQLELGVYSTDQVNSPDFLANPPAPAQKASVTVVGIGVFPDEILQDDADRTSRLLMTPALSREWKAYGAFGLQGLILRHGDADLRSFLDHLATIVPIGDVEIRQTSVDEANALTAINPLSLVLEVFGAIAAVVGALLSCQALARSIRSTRDDMRMVVVFGASNREVALLSLLSSALAAVGGIVLGAIAAVVASPLMPIGPVRRVEPEPGIDVNVAVLGLGAVVALTILIASSAWVAWRELRPTRARSSVGAATTGNVALIAVTHLPPPSATGTRFALGDRHRIAARSAIISAVGASAAIIAAVSFAASLHRLVREPAQYGWNFDTAVVSGNGYDNLDNDRVNTILGDDHAVATWSGVYFGADSVGDVDVPLLGMQPGSTVHPPLAKGRFIDAADEIVLGQATAKSLHVDVGDQIVLEGDNDPRTMRVVGIAVLPAIGKTHAQHTSLGRGAIVVPSMVPGSDLDILGNHHDEALGPNALFIRFAPGVDAASEIEHLRQTTAPLTSFAGLDVIPVQRPAEIVSSDDVGAAPLLLAIGLAVGATIALVIVLAASVRSHRRELAVLTALGFTKEQRAATLMWHSTIVVALGLLIGVPLGAVIGRELWHQYAGRIHVLAPAVIPWRAAGVIVVASLLLAVALGLGPARAARRLNTAAALREQ